MHSSKIVMHSYKTKINKKNKKHNVKLQSKSKTEGV